MVVVVVIGMIGVAAMVPVIGHGVSDRRAADAAHDRTDRTADDSPGNSTAEAPVTKPFWSAKAI
jgi:hypothetical protein